MADGQSVPNESSSRIASMKALSPHLYEEKEEEEEEEEEGYGDESSSSSSDPSYDLAEEACSGVSKLSMKKSECDESCESSDGDLEEQDVQVPALDEKDEKSYVEVVKLIEGGKLHKLKVDQCKVYLRKFGLRLAGTKAVLIERIQEHLEIKDGSGETKYPKTSFKLNCKGDACTGDVVMFEQNVYEMYSIASRSATGPSIGTRVVVGRIVKESYGAAKQQHTFTIEVLWSTGVNPLPPLHPLLIKGRNLYRLKTVRQPWPNEEERTKVLEEKHSRGFVARRTRDTRVKDKELGRSHRPRHIQKETVSVPSKMTNKDSDKKAEDRMSCGDVNGTSVPAQALIVSHNTVPLGQNCGNAPLIDHSGYRGTRVLQDCNKIQSASAGYNHTNANVEYSNNFHSAAGTVGSNNNNFTTSNKNIFATSSISTAGHFVPKHQSFHPQMADLIGCLPQVTALPHIRPVAPMSAIYNNSILGSRPATGFHAGKKIEPCRHFLRGRCNYGVHCKFAHDTSLVSYDANHPQHGIHNKENNSSFFYK